MPIDTKVAQLINEHVPHELYAHHAYLRMSLDANRIGMFGVEKWFAKQSAEERDHMVKLLTYINDFDMANAIPASAAQPGTRYGDALSMFTDALVLEQSVTARISALRRAAWDAGDCLTFEFLSWFVNEQRDSEIVLGDILNRLTKSTHEQLLTFDEWIAGL